MNNLAKWFVGLVSVMLSAIGSAGAVIVVDPAKFNLSHDGLIALGKVCAIVALGAAFNYLQHSPLSQIATSIGVIQAGNVNVQSPEKEEDVKTTTTKLGVLALISILLMGSMTACSGTKVAQNIVNWTPALEGAVGTINSTAALLLPEDAQVFVKATAGFNAAATELDLEAKAYLANPSASVLAKLQAAAVTLQQTVNTSLLEVAGIKDPASQQHALAAINAVAVISSLILGLVQSISSKTALAQMSRDSTIKLAAVRPYLDDGKLKPIAEQYHTSVVGFFQREAAAGF